MEEHLKFEENYLVYENIGTRIENRQTFDNLSFIISVPILTGH